MASVDVDVHRPETQSHVIVASSKDEPWRLHCLIIHTWLDHDPFAKECERHNFVNDSIGKM